VFLKGVEEGSGHVPEQEFMTFLERDFGKGHVIIIRIFVINVLHSYSKSINFLGTRHDYRRRRNLP